MHNKINQGFSLLGSTPIMFPFQDNYSNKEKKMIEFAIKKIFFFGFFLFIYETVKTCCDFRMFLSSLESGKKEAQKLYESITIFCFFYLILKNDVGDMDFGTDNAQTLNIDGVMQELN